MFNYCPNCGTKILREGSKFCSSCGESFDRYLANYNQSNTITRNNNSFYEEKRLGIPVYCLVFGDTVEKLFLYNNEFYRDIDCRFKYGFTVKDYSMDPHAFNHVKDDFHHESVFDKDPFFNKNRR